MLLTRRHALGTFAAALPSPRPPNILLLIADEWRAQVPTEAAPNLTALAVQSLDFRRAYTAYPVCCPSRAALFTGRTPREAGVTRNHSLLPLSNTTLPGNLRQAGYRTGFTGKWHLDGRASPGFVPMERRRGFEFWAAFNLQHQHYDTVCYRDTPDPIAIPGFQPAALTGFALEFLAARDRRPWFLCVSYVAPHPPLTPPPGHAFDPGKIELRPNVPAALAATARRDLAAYYGLCHAVDQQIGRLLQSLPDPANTVVLFTSDHGTTLHSHGRDEIDTPFEESVRIPCLLRYPARFKPRVIEDRLISNTDFAPLLEALAAGRKPPPARRLVSAEGSLGEPGQWHMLVTRRYKLVTGPSREPAHAYDLLRDPYELHDLVPTGRLPRGMPKSRDVPQH